MFLLPENFWKVKSTPLKGRGVFAKKNIKAGSIIGDYVGKIVRIGESTRKENSYLMHCNETFAILPSISAVGIHLINHSCQPNCGIFMYQAHALYFSLRQIYKGEEMNVCYMNGSPSKKDLAFENTCHCQSPLCRGTMFNPEILNDRLDDYFRQNEKEFYGKTPTKEGDKVMLLSNYPTFIPDDPVFDIFGSVTKTPLLINEKRMPELKKLRKLIRESGRQLKLSSLGIEVYGIMNGLIISRYATTSNS